MSAPDTERVELIDGFDLTRMAQRLEALARTIRRNPPASGVIEYAYQPGTKRPASLDIRLTWDTP